MTEQKTKATTALVLKTFSIIKEISSDTVQTEMIKIKYMGTFLQQSDTSILRFSSCAFVYLLNCCSQA